MLGSGLITVNLTDEYELPCIASYPGMKQYGSWHQATNSIRVILCERVDKHCKLNGENAVFMAVIHNKIRGLMGLPARYERYVMVWSAVPPFSMLGISEYPLLMRNEAANGFSEEENWQDDPEHQRMLEEGGQGKPLWARFTYTVSMAWAWGRKGDTPNDKNVGFFDDNVIIGVGVDDEDCIYAIAVAREFMNCLRACPGRSPTKVSTARPHRVKASSSRKSNAPARAGDLPEGVTDAEGDTAEAALLAKEQAYVDAVNETLSEEQEQSPAEEDVPTDEQTTRETGREGSPTDDEEGGPSVVPVGAQSPTESVKVDMVPANVDADHLDRSAPSKNAPPPMVGAEAAAERP